VKKIENENGDGDGAQGYVEFIKTLELKRERGELWCEKEGE
jgi:hypothetical protein